MKRGIFASALITLLLIAASPASAAPFTPELEAAYTASLAAWGHPEGPPNCGIVERDMLPSDSVSDTRASLAGVYHSVCTLTIGGAIRPCEVNEIMLHEVGHLMGYPHDLDPTSIMYDGGLTLVECSREEVAIHLAKARRLARECRRWVRAWRGECRSKVRFIRARAAAIAAEEGSPQTIP